VLQHLGDLDVALTEVARVLKADGVLVAAVVHPVAEVGTYDADRDELAVGRYFEARTQRMSLGDGEIVRHHRTIEAYMRALAAAALTLDDLREVPGRSGSVPLYLGLRAHL
jgi:ubiquinone/menaquinone biosynthesis C-methylase UbiE